MYLMLVVNLVPGGRMGDGGGKGVTLARNARKAFGKCLGVSA